MTRRFLAGAILAAAFSLTTAARAEAIPIGSFGWIAECDQFAGPCFSIVNFADFQFPLEDPSNLSFSNLVIQLNADSGEDPLVPQNFVDPPGTIGAGRDAQTVRNLSNPLITSATLGLTFGLPGVIALLDENDSPIDLLSIVDRTVDVFATIDFTPAPQSVPEPATLLLVAGGLGLFACHRRRQRPARNSD